MAAEKSLSATLNKNICKWTECLEPGPYDSVQELADHVTREHVDYLLQGDIVLCLWEGCKVYNVPCQKKAWLAPHMRRHTNERPHKCIMNGCNQSFWSMQALDNHLQLHLVSSPVKSNKKRPKSSSPAKLPTTDHVASSKEHAEMNGLELTHEEAQSDGKVPELVNFDTTMDEPSPVDDPIPLNGGLLHSDLIDSKMMTLVRRAVEGNYSKNNGSTKEITLTGMIIGKRTRSKDNIKDYLIKWTPNVIPDSWVCQNDYTGTRTIPISELTHCQRVALVSSSYFTLINTCKRPRKRKTQN